MILTSMTIHTAYIKRLHPLFPFAMSLSLSGMGDFKKALTSRNDLHRAVCNKDITEITTVLKNNIDVNSKDFCGNTPLHYAAWKNNAQAITLLLKNGAKIDAQNSMGNTPLLLCCLYQYNDHRGAGNALMKAGASLDILNKSGLSAYNFVQVWMINQQLFIERSNNFHNTAQAIKVNDIDSVKTWLKISFKESADQNGNTLLHYAVSSGNQDIIGLILRLNPHFITKINNKGQTPMDLSIGHPPIFNLFKALTTDTLSQQTPQNALSNPWEKVKNFFLSKRK